ncbi:MAG: Abi-alpha family protein [bacterium]|nr:Abi-alpha family protein [bacterium]
MTELKEINIKSSTIEKGLELAKDFLGKLISPTIEEVGLLISDNVKFLRFKNQVRILLKAKSYVEKHNISLKEIPIKILVPLLDKASLEDDELLQDKWAKMLVNMVDSENNLQNQIFPYTLSQISIEEYNALKELLQKELLHREEKKQLASLREADKFLMNVETKKLNKQINKIEQDGFILMLEEFECANLVRLGLVRELPPKILIEEFKTGGSEYDSREEWHQIDAEYDIDDFGNRITELGEKFIQICELEEKKIKI